LSDDFTEIEVAEAKSVAGGVVNKRLLIHDLPQSQSTSVPNPQNLD
jgi:hypothetical protein